MKKIFLTFAAMAALASCVEEKSLDPQPQQPAGNQITVKAVAADTKTVLGEDGTSVLWEGQDAIGVVLKGKDTHLETLTTSLTEKNAEAEFTAVLSDELAADANVTGAGYAVYPSTSIKLENGIIAITHELPEVQTGTITFGMNLSYALVNADALLSGEAEATFHNALTLLKIIVPSGVKSVALTSSSTSADLVGNATFTATTYTATEKDENDNEIQVDKLSFEKKGSTSKRSVTLSNGEELAAGTHYLLVFPGTARELTFTVTGTDGAEYKKTFTDITFVASSYRTIDLTRIFSMNTTETMYAKPAGEVLPVDIATTGDFTYNVSITNNDPSWITYEEVGTKGFHGESIVFTVAENKTGADREAEVTITWDKGTRKFKISQPNIYMDFVYTDENPIQWQESFGLYASESDATNAINVKAEYTNVFTIELSDDFNKGTYKINKMFVYNNVYSGRIGGTYYANYSNGVLTVFKGDQSTYSYAFANEEIALAYDSTTKTFKSESPIEFGYHFENADLKNGGFIGGYSAVLKTEEEPEEPESPDNVTSLYGYYTETFVSSWPSPGKTKISESDNPEYDVKILFFYKENQSSHDTAYGVVSDDGTKITVTYLGYSTIFGPIESFDLTVSNGTLTGDFNGKFPSYSATYSEPLN